MVRTQVQFTGAELDSLRRLSVKTGKSIAELVRNGIDEYLARQRASATEDRVERALRVAGMFSSGRKDISAQHDRYLAESFDER